MKANKINYLYIGTLLFILGCFLGLQWWSLEKYKWSILVMAVLVLLGISLKRFNRFWQPCLCFCFLLLGLWAGAGGGENPSNKLQPYFQKELLAYGSIAPESVRQYPYGTSFVLRCERLYVKTEGSILKRKGASEKESLLPIWEAGCQNGESPQILKAGYQNGELPQLLEVGYRQKLRVFTKEKNLPLMGKAWCQGELVPLTTFRNPGGFDGQRWNYLQGLGGRLRKAQVEVASYEGRWLDRLAVFNLHLRAKIMSVAGGEEGALLCGMLLGGSTGLSDEVREAFANNGLAHLLSVSGTHFALLAGFLLLVFKPLPVKLRKLLILLLLCAYAVLCGLKPPIMRALGMSVVLLYGGSGSARGNLLCLTGMVLLIFSPAWLLDIGFQLSFGAVAGLIWLYPKLKNYFCSCLPVIVGEAMALTVAAQLAVLPFLVAYFHQLTIISFISNIFLVPVLEVVTLLTMVGTALDFLLPFGAGFIKLAAWLVEQILVQAKFLGSLPLSTVVIGNLPLWCAVIYYFALALWADLPCLQFLRNRERRVFLLTASLFLCGVFLWKSFAPVPLTAYFLDVGQGDCAVVITPGQKVIVIDTGGLKNFDTGSRVLVPFLRSLGKSRVDALLLSHGDYDHAGGAGALARNMKIERIVLPATSSLTEAEEALLRNGRGSLVERASLGKKYELDGVVLEILDVPSSENIYEPEGNEASTVASIKYGKHSLLFTGDINSSREKHLQNIGRYDVLKVAHHGSKHSSSLKFLEAVQPKLAVISVGGGNGYGHPHSETLARLARVGSKVVRTDELGAVKVVFGKEINCYGFSTGSFKKLLFNNS